MREKLEGGGGGGGVVVNNPKARGGFITSLYLQNDVDDRPML